MGEYCRKVDVSMGGEKRTHLWKAEVTDDETNGV